MGPPTYERLAVEIDVTPGGQAKLIWSAHSEDNDFYPVDPYHVSASRLQQASDDVGKLVARLIAGDGQRSDAACQSMISALRERGVTLFKHLLPQGDGRASAAVAELLETRSFRGEPVSKFSERPHRDVHVLLHIRLCERLHVPWGLVCHPDVLTTSPGEPPSSRDLQGFWIESRKLVVIHQNRSEGGHGQSASSALSLADAVLLSGRCELRRWFNMDRFQT